MYYEMLYVIIICIIYIIHLGIMDQNSIYRANVVLPFVFIFIFNYAERVVKCG